MPSAMALSAVGREKKAYRAALRSGRQLCALGLNFNLAPVLGVKQQSGQPGDRYPKLRPQRRRRMALCLSGRAGLSERGRSLLRQAFPGHGDTLADSHLEPPVNHQTLDGLLETEIASFAQAIQAGLPAVTIAHVVYDQLDEAPATMSRRIVTDWLRDGWTLTVSSFPTGWK